MLGILYDTITNCSKGGQDVSDYMLCVFTATITVSVVCFSLISLVTSFSKEEYLGYKLRDVFQFPESPVNVQKYTYTSFGIALASAISLAIAFFFQIELNGVMTALLMVLLITELSVAIKLCKMIFDERELVTAITMHFRVKLDEPNSVMNYEEFREHTKRILSELAVYIREKDAVKKNDVYNMLLLLVQKLHKDEKDFQQFHAHNYFYSTLREHMESFSESFGYNEMLSFVSRLYRELPEAKNEALDLYLIPLKKLKFHDDKFLSEHPYYKEISEIYQLDEYMNGGISDDSAERIMFAYFEGIIHNQSATLKTKENLIDQFIGILMKFTWKSVKMAADGVEPDLHVLLVIHRDYVLEKKVGDLQLSIFHSLCKNAFLSRAWLWGGEQALHKYYDFLALLFQSFYACVFCETEVLSEEYRNSLQMLYKTPIELTPTDIRGINQLIYKEIQGILHAMVRRISKDEDALGELFELYKQMVFKNVIWTEEFNINYCFMLYLIYYSRVMAELGAFVNVCKLADDKKDAILFELQNKFDMQSKNLTVNFKDKCMEYGEFLEHPLNISKEFQHIIFEIITQKHSELKQKLLTNHPADEITADSSEIQKKLNSKMETEQIFGWTTDLDKSSNQVSSIPMFIPPSICKRDRYKDEHIIRILQDGIIHAVQKHIQLHSRKLKLTFNLSGVKDLNSFFQSENYTARNYTYTNNGSLLRLSDDSDFKDLKKAESNLENVNTNPFYEKMYFNKNAFRFCAQVTKIEKEPLSDEECISILDNSQAFSGKYVVDGALMAKEQAINYIKDAYWKENYQFDLVLGWMPDDITYIDFDLAGSLS